MIKDTDFAYAAGYADGDGCFYIGKLNSENRIRYRALFIINSTSIENMQWFQRIFGGNITTRKNSSPNAKPIHRYVLKGKNLEKFSGIGQFLREKMNDFAIFYQFIDSTSNVDRDLLIQDSKNIKETMFHVSKEKIDQIEYLKTKPFTPDFTEYAYLAGLIDAECSLNIQKDHPKNRPNPTYKILLQCNNTKYPIFMFLAQFFGGQFHYIDRSKYVNYKDQITWRISSKSLYPILKKVLPFLKHKKPVCEELIKLYETTFNRIGSPSPNSKSFSEFYKPILEEKERIFHNVKQLNKKGI